MLLPRRVLVLRLADYGSGSMLCVWSQLLRHHSLPDSSISVYGWHRFVRSHFEAESHTVVTSECSHLPLGRCVVPGQPILHWGIIK